MRPLEVAATLLLITLTQNYSSLTRWLSPLRAKTPRRPWDRACCFFIYFIAFFFSSNSVRKIRACADEIARTKEDKKLEPVSSTSRRGARAAYHDDHPRDFGPRIAYTVS